MKAVLALSRRLYTTTTMTKACCCKDKMVVIMGATGTGKSRLAVDLAARFPAEVINADKIQLYRGLDVTTNKITPAERRGVPHHLLGFLDPAAGELHPRRFRALADQAAAGIAARRRLPLLAGGSNSLIYALLAGDGGAGGGLRYDCCFLWVDVAAPALFEYLDVRVGDMLGLGMAEELRAFYDPAAAAEPPAAIRRAIGVAEFDRYFAGEADFSEAVEAIKLNTRQLAVGQVEKIQRLSCAGWTLHRLDGSDAVRRALESDRTGFAQAWARDVLEPSVKIVKQFLRAHS